jgi:hypothetical protein
MVGYLISFTAVKKKELVLRLAIERVVVLNALGGLGLNCKSVEASRRAPRVRRAGRHFRAQDHPALGRGLVVDEQANALRALANYRGPVTQCPRASSAEDPCGVVWLAYGLFGNP